jgi:hypothetical protein
MIENGQGKGNVGMLVDMAIHDSGADAFINIILELLAFN